MELFVRARSFFWLVPVILGVIFVGAGLYMVSEGRAARDEVREAIIAENIVTPEDAPIPNTPVTDAETAKAQAEVIRQHTLNLTGGKTYAQLDREDPLRQTYLTSVTLRTALSMAVMGFKVSDLVIGMGFFMVLIGATHVFFLAPAVYYAARVANEQARRLARETLQAGDHASG